MFTASAENLINLEKAGIVRFEGVSGQPTNAETAVEAPTLVKVKTLSGLTMSLIDRGDGTFDVVED